MSSKCSKAFAFLRHQYTKTTRQNYSVWAVGNSGSKPVIPYVAISHVWSGGLGNPHSNSLPKCQLVRIQNLVNVLYGEQLRPVPFWIDTLYVPREIETRRLAISSMNSVYQEADKVLVLDNLLLSIRISRNPVENLMRIRSTRWLQRLWTFQEGILASSLYFQFVDGAVLGKDLVVQMENRQREAFTEARGQLKIMLRDRVKASKHVLDQIRNNLNIARPGAQNPWLGQHPQAHDLVSYFAKLVLRGLRFQNSIHTGTLLKKKNEAEVLSQLSRSLRWRRTMRPEDEALVLANLLGTDVGGLLDVRKEVTLKRILLSIGSVPSDVLFLRQDRVAEPGCGWIPMTFLDSGTGAALGLHLGNVTPAGLNVQLPGIQLTGSLDDDETGATVTIQVPGNLVYRTRILFRQRPSSRFPDEESNYAVILQNPLSNITPVVGALVVVQADLSKVMTVLWFGVVVITPSLTTEDTATSFVGKVLPPSQKWVVG